MVDIQRTNKDENIQTPELFMGLLINLVKGEL